MNDQPIGVTGTGGALAQPRIVVSQIIATSHDFTSKGSLGKENPFISGKCRLMKYYDLARSIL